MIPFFSFIGCVAFSYFLNVILLSMSSNAAAQGRRAEDGYLRWGKEIRPATGGISFYINFLLGSVILLLVLQQKLLSLSHEILGLFLSATLAFFIGLADDVFRPRSFIKLLGQIACGCILIFFDIKIHYFQHDIGDTLLTLFWVVGIMNSIRLLDTMDGVAGLVSLSIMAITMMIAIRGGGFTALFYLLVIISAGLVGFLFLNLPPSKAYLGDSGGMFLGLVLAYAGIPLFWNIYSDPDNRDMIRQLIIPVLVFAVPIIDTTCITFRRLSLGISPIIAGPDHITHRLASLGIPSDKMSFVLSGVSLLLGLLAVQFCRMIPNWEFVWSLLGLFFVIALSIFTYVLYQKGQKKAQETQKKPLIPIPKKNVGEIDPPGSTTK